MYRFLIMSASLWAAFGAIQSMGAAESAETEIEAEELFIPVGFDDNDEVTAVLAGYLPDPCHRLIKPYLSIDPVFKQITVSVRTRRFAAECPAVAVPFTLEVPIGALPSGNYEVVTKSGNLKGKLSVARSSAHLPDDYLYAPVDSARIEYLADGRRLAILEGHFTNTCLKMQETKVILTGRTIQVIPIMKFGLTEECGKICRIEERAFKIQVELPALPEEGRYLLHVRSLNGQAVNEVFYRDPKRP